MNPIAIRLLNQQLIAPQFSTPAEVVRYMGAMQAQMLLTSGHTIGETSDLLGFEYPQHFTRMFKKFYGYPPSHFGKK